MKYKRVVISRKGLPEVLQVVEEELAEPGASEVRIKIFATGITFADVAVRKGVYPTAPPIPFAPGYDIVGVVDKGRCRCIITISGTDCRRAVASF